MTENEPFDAPSTARAWNWAADAWEQFVESGADYYRAEVHGPALLEACGNVDGLQVLDLGCGQGYFTRQLAAKGASVVGVDVAEMQLQNARLHEEEMPLGIKYLLMDAAQVVDEWPKDTFDMVTSCMALQDMPQPGRVLQSARQVLKPGGRAVLSLPHPFSDMPFREWERDESGEKLALKVDRYFESGRKLLRWNMARLMYPWETPCWGLTLSEWSELMSGAGFLIRRIHEPRPTEDQVRRLPQMDDCYRLPYFLVSDLAIA